MLCILLKYRAARNIFSFKKQKKLTIKHLCYHRVHNKNHIHHHEDVSTMNSQPLYLFLVFFAFGLCGWLGCASFLYEGSSWLKIENPSIQSLLFHENSVRVFLLSLLWGGLCAFPFQWMHRKKQQMLGMLLFLPLSITIIPAIYLYLWPSQSFSFSWYEQLKIIIAQGWPVFSILYLLCIFIPFSLWSHRARKDSLSNE